MRAIIFTTVLVLCTNGLLAQGAMNINITGLKNNNGQIVLLLFKEENEFGIRKKPFQIITCSSISDKKASFSIDNVLKGTYAFLVFHDEDSNWNCSTNLIGMPKEGIGSSRNVVSKPTFNNSKFSFSDEQKSFNIKIKYL